MLDLKKLHRKEIIGKEGGVPPIYIEWSNVKGDLVGTYHKVSLSLPPITTGEMFGHAS